MRTSWRLFPWFRPQVWKYFSNYCHFKFALKINKGFWRFFWNFQLLIRAKLNNSISMAKKISRLQSKSKIWLPKHDVKGSQQLQKIVSNELHVTQSLTKNILPKIYACSILQYLVSCKISRNAFVVILIPLQMNKKEQIFRDLRWTNKLYYYYEECERELYNVSISIK